MYASYCPVIALVVQLLASYHSDTVQLLSGYDTDIIQISSSSSCGPIFGQLWSNYSPEIWLYFGYLPVIVWLLSRFLSQNFFLKRSYDLDVHDL